jgi:hypothetical protein
MEMANAIISALGDLLVLITVIVAVRARSDARTAEASAEKTRKEFADQQRSWQRETELVRRRQRVQQVGETIEDLFWAVQDNVPPDQWMRYRNHLGQLLVGLTDAVPSCEAILTATTTDAARGPARLGRDEVTNELDRIDQELRRLHNPAIPASE